jgi:phosphoserine phosphatase
VSRLVIQHPTLTDATIEAFANVIGRQPTERIPGQLAAWMDVTLSSIEVTRLADRFAVDAEIAPARASLSDYRLIAFDMDSTLITVECVDEIADYAGRKAEVAAITEAAMRGEITDYNESLRQRVALLEGLPESVLQRVYDERIELSPGTERLVTACKQAGLKTLVVSGGFTFFTDRIRDRLGLDFARSNTLEIVNGHLTGRLVGEIVNAEVKRQTVEATCAQIACSTSQAIVVGDGANDLKMMAIAGISVAYRAKPIVRSETTHGITHCGLDAILGFFPQKSGIAQATHLNTGGFAGNSR